MSEAFFLGGGETEGHDVQGGQRKSALGVLLNTKRKKKRRGSATLKKKVTEEADGRRLHHI